jgi:hypothetical protein
MNLHMDGRTCILFCTGFAHAYKTIHLVAVDALNFANCIPYADDSFFFLRTFLLRQDLKFEFPTVLPPKSTVTVTGAPVTSGSLKKSWLMLCRFEDIHNGKKSFN